MLIQFLFPLAILVLFLFAFLLFRTALWGGQPEPVEPVSLPDVDDWTVAEHLSRAIQHETISYDDPARFNKKAFLALHKDLASMFPRLHRSLQLEKINEYSLLYTWVGSNPELKPILLMSHLDVVPVEEGTEKAWTHPPFSGQIADGYVWGRGAMDIKSGVITIMEAVECLLVSGFKPERTIFLAFGHDEELSGRHGAGTIVETLQQRGVELDVVLDEGGSMMAGVVPWVDQPVALVGVGEKGYMSLTLTAETAGGHSAVPPKQTAIGILARAIARLEAHPMPDRLGLVTAQFQALSSELPFFLRLLFANRWLLGGLLRRQIGGNPRTAALIHTTTAPTMISAGVKDNILPRKARAVVNFRLLPGDSVETVVNHVRRVIDDPSVTLGPLFEDPLLNQSGEAGEAESEQRLLASGRAAPPISDPQGEGFRLLETTIRQVFPEMSVAPVLSTGATDARYYTAICPQVLRFMPFRYGPEDQSRVHGVDERLSIKNCGDAVRFFMTWIQKF